MLRWWASHHGWCSELLHSNAATANAPYTDFVPATFVQTFENYAISEVHVVQDIAEHITLNKQRYVRNTDCVHHRIYAVRRTNRQVQRTSTTPAQIEARDRLTHIRTSLIQPDMTEDRLWKGSQKGEVLHSPNYYKNQDRNTQGVTTLKLTWDKVTNK